MGFLIPVKGDCLLFHFLTKCKHIGDLAVSEVVRVEVKAPQSGGQESLFYIEILGASVSTAIETPSEQ